MISVLLVDDDPDLLALMRIHFEAAGTFAVTPCSSVADAIAVTGDKRFDAVISDFNLPGDNGARLLDTIRSQGQGTFRVLYSAVDPDFLKKKVPAGCADRIIQRCGNPFAEWEEILSAIRSAGSPAQ